MSDKLDCWQCGAELAGIILPLSRREECADCGADQHVCKLCRFYDISVADECTEERAEDVSDKERANFCDYFEPKANAYQVKLSEEKRSSAQQLADLFGDEPVENEDQQDVVQGSPTQADDALAKLKKLFGDDD